MRHKNMEKRGQMAIFVIVALVLVGSIIAFFALKGLNLTGEVSQVNPRQVIEKCLRDSINEVVDKMLEHGGFVNPVPFKTYNGTVAYMCVNDGYLRPCIQQHPMLLNEMKNEIKTYVTPVLEQCFEGMQEELDSRGYVVTLGPMNVNISLAPQRVFADVVRRTAVTKGENVQTIEGYSAEIVNPLYDLANVAIEISNQEAKYCNFENVGYSVLYPQTDVQKWMTSDSTKIYSIKDKFSGKTMRIATRSCALPVGLI